MSLFRRKAKKKDINAYAAEAQAEGTPLVDVREAAEFQDGHIPGAVNVPLSVFKDEFSKAYPDKGQKIYLYCRSGARSGQALSAANRLGYSAVVNIGGIIDWKGQAVK